MMLARLKHVHRFRDRHGTVRYYLRVPGTKAVALPGLPGSAEFLAAYAAALGKAEKPVVGVLRSAPGSLNALAVAWLASAHWRSLRASTQANYRRHLDILRGKHGDKPVKLLDTIGVRRLLAEAGERSSTAPHHLLRVLRGLMAFAVETGILATDPTTGIKRSKHRAQGFATWTEAHIEQYEAHWPTGTRERLALTLLLYTALRRSDVVTLGKQHRAFEAISGRQVDCHVITDQKTERRVVVPVHPHLVAELAHVGTDRLTYLVTAQGRPFTSGGFYNAFADAAREAGLPVGLGPHGLRKAMSRRLAEAGASNREAMAILGHSTMGEAERYSRAADTSRLAAAGMGRIVNIGLQTTPPKSRKPGKKPK